MPSLSRKYRPPGKGLANGGRCPKHLGFSVENGGGMMVAKGVRIVFLLFLCQEVWLLTFNRFCPV